MSKTARFVRYFIYKKYKSVGSNRQGREKLLYFLRKSSFFSEKYAQGQLIQKRIKLSLYKTTVKLEKRSQKS
ncbi:hypothetical protein [Anaerobiospirillum thomasii]|uniref:hypothetical protein n=1 Tax=Anaerobiospirillum thomasii TaxID=179995 RepID=UPI000DE5ADF2|nr:hypothetical protein [Anaerobiospirillum thomasii]